MIAAHHHNYYHHMTFGLISVTSLIEYDLSGREKAKSASITENVANLHTPTTRERERAALKHRTSIYEHGAL